MKIQTHGMSMAQARVYMQFVFMCPQCSRWLRFEPSIVGDTLGDRIHRAFVKKAFESPAEPVEVPVTCRDCGHEFVVDSFRV